MSQFFLNTAAGPTPPFIPTSFQTQNGTAVPASNIIIVNGESSTQNNQNGIITNGGTPATTNGNEVDIILTNRATGTTTTTATSSSTLITLPLGTTPGVYTFEIVIAGFAKSGIGAPLGCGYTIVGSVRTTGTAAFLIPTQVVDHFEEGALGNPPQALASLGVSGNNAIISVTGVSDGSGGFAIDWNATLNYTFSS
jgi:hypothetical protein